MSTKAKHASRDTAEPNQGEKKIGRRQRGPTERVCVSINKDLLAEADADAERRGMSRTSYFSNALREFMDIETSEVTRCVMVCALSTNACAGRSISPTIGGVWSSAPTRLAKS